MNSVNSNESKIHKQKCITNLPRSEADKTWMPSIMPPLPPSTAGLSRQSSRYIEDSLI